MTKGKTAIITGSTSGIGLGIAEAMAKAGMNVMLNGFGDAAEILAAVHQPGDRALGREHHDGDQNTALNDQRIVALHGELL